MPDLASLQQQFADHIVTHDGDAALLATINDNGIAPAQRLQIHQNNYALLLDAALASTFKAVHGAVGVDFFSFMARQFVQQHPPKTTELARYGDLFPAFIRTVAQADALPWLPDLAALEWARAALLAGYTDSATIRSDYPIDLLWQGMQDPPLIDAADIDLQSGPTIIKLHFHNDTLFFTRIDED